MAIKDNQKDKDKREEKTGGDSISDTPAHNSTASAAPFRA